MGKEDVYYYRGETPLVIVTAWHADPDGGPATQDTTIMLRDGQGIDVSILGLSRSKLPTTPPPPDEL